jgi:quercetin dioxygenase-like cupin family protein
MQFRQVISHTAVGCAAAAAAFLVAKGDIRSLTPSFAQAPAAASGQRSTELFKQTMTDVMGRQLIVRLTERDPGNGSPAHRHPGAHTVGYILEGSYEVKIDDGPVRTLKPGEVFYEYPNALHAISRNPSTTAPLKYLVIQVYDATKPGTVPEPH